MSTLSTVSVVRIVPVEVGFSSQIILCRSQLNIGMISKTFTEQVTFEIYVQSAELSF